MIENAPIFGKHNVGMKPSSMISVLRYAGIALGAAATFALISLVSLAAYMSNRISRPRRSRRPSHYTFTPWEFQIPYHEVEIPVGEHSISGWFLPQNEPEAPCVLAFSGFASHKAELLGICSNLYRDGFAIMLIDFRGTGRSPGDVVTMGHNETDDARAALDWLTKTCPGSKIGVLGYSMGGSVALMLAATDSRIDAVVSDSAFATQRDILEHHVRLKTGIWPRPVISIAGPMLRRRHGRNYDDFAPAAVVDRISPRPLFLIHPKDDQVVPFAHGEEIWENAREPKTSWFPDGCGHCGAYFQDRADYCQRLSSFFRAALNSQCS